MTPALLKKIAEDAELNVPRDVEFALDTFPGRRRGFREAFDVQKKLLELSNGYLGDGFNKRDVDSCSATQ